MKIFQWNPVFHEKNVYLENFQNYLKIRTYIKLRNIDFEVYLQKTIIFFKIILENHR